MIFGSVVGWRVVEPVVLTMSEEAYFRKNSQELVRQSERELAEWKRSRNEVFLQQACEKAFSALEQVTSLRSKRKFSSHAEFRKVFRLTFKGRDSLLLDADEIHKFFYNGLSFDDPVVMERSLARVLSFVKGVRS
jgi:hypothetical protein